MLFISTLHGGWTPGKTRGCKSKSLGKKNKQKLNPPKPLLNCLCPVSATPHHVHLLLDIQIKTHQHMACCPLQQHPSFGSHFTSPDCTSRYPNEQRGPAACATLFFRDRRKRGAEPRVGWCVFAGNEAFWGSCASFGARLGCLCLGAGNWDSFNTVLSVGSLCTSRGKGETWSARKQKVTFLWDSKHYSLRALCSDFPLVIFIYGK